MHRAFLDIAATASDYHGSSKSSKDAPPKTINDIIDIL